MLEVRLLKAQDLLDMMKIETTGITKFMSDHHAFIIEESKKAISVFIDGELKACGGVVEYWPNRGEAWIMFGKINNRDFFKIQRVAKRYIKSCSIRRIEAAVEVDLKQGHRWVKSCGFTMDAPLLKAYTPEGKDCVLYSLVRE